MIRQGHIESADRVSTDMFADPTLGRVEQEAIGSSLLLIGATYIEYAESIAPVAPDDARIAAGKGLAWLLKVATSPDLERAAISWQERAVAVSKLDRGP